ncbi:MAG TPA: hypothetical protein VD905_19585 [Flavobacteriales bacterium]|nr:hypothetical protein [Flavobacteriales bacterium]
MTKETKKKVWMQTNLFFLIASASTGMTYRLINPGPNDRIPFLILGHIVGYAFVYLISYYGFKTAIKKGQIKE